ncbi:hypothetical protein [Streptococcus sobrinus]|uniref:hypothetical protein n=1 Tax=Streptococcus sobrinus TaxID=1310 RepID=UPI000368ACAF|nr:hypothetical protein [Streptococcus sobrinus]AWN18260.1 hypothetical protein DK181_01895 [Streptococcus sobrinus]
MSPQWFKYRNSLRGLNIALLVMESVSLAFNGLFFILYLIFLAAYSDLERANLDSLIMTNFVLLVMPLIVNALLLGLFIHNQKRLKEEPAQLLTKPVSSLAYCLGFLPLIQVLLAFWLQSGFMSQLFALLFRLAFSILCIIALVSRHNLLQALKASAEAAYK